MSERQQISHEYLLMMSTNCC